MTTNFGDRAAARSPFSITHEWTFVPTILPEPISAGHAPMRLPMEEIGLQAIGHIGCIGSVQITRLFHWKRHQVRRMLAEHKLVQHELRKNKNTIPIFTLGPRSIQLFKTDQSVNSWRHWSIGAVLSKLVFFQFCCALHEKQKGFQILQAAPPFTGKVQMGEHLRYVLVLRGKEDDVAFERELRLFSQPVVILAEKLEDVHPYNHVLSSAHLLLDQDLREDYKFLRLRAGEWCRS
ncbi:hypothetical protein ASL14_19155 [Paenibacillus sp. IHB B 3084]|uniref:hypothetical protein n=1 Tax=Paenibacillus sp. IHB B 3084 TaxID=867076 RepID=UPI00071EB54C|nr:hypothetical protein [Paenibacillus sp. IHB B 3084]ALP37990.1 hypothetical protein ASL14_19155 [Paenibacillus sp. IHB B 3084]